MRALFCGINGKDGSFLAKLLLEKGYEVWGTSRDAQTLLLNNLQALDVAERVNVISMAPTSGVC